MSLVLERANAKINLTLDVFYKRPDGYHEVDMVMQTVDLSDLIWLEELQSDVIEIESNASHIPLDGRNLAVVAAKVFKEQTGLRRGVKIRIDKHIPVAAGLGGGSADAAAVLRGLSRLWNTGHSLDELAEMGAAIGSDVPFCVFGGCAIAAGRGEHITKVAHHCRAWVVLVRPSVFVSTADVYQSLRPEDFTNHVTSSAMVLALQSGDLEQVRSHVTNTLAPRTFTLYPEVEAMKHRFENIARSPVHMSGSGPTLYCLVKNESTGSRIVNALRGFTKEVYLCRMV